MKKKNISILLLMMLSLCGCGTKGKVSSSSPISDLKESSGSSESSSISYDEEIDDSGNQIVNDKRNGKIPMIDEVDKTITYGLYPQTHVKDNNTIKALNQLTKVEDNGFCLYDYNYYYKFKATPFSSDLTFNDGKDIISGTSYWFKCERITWNILSSADGEYFLVSDKVLDVHKYNDMYEGTDENGYYANNYKNSSIRNWLNSTFYNTAFSLDDSYIITTTVDNSATTTDSSKNTYCCENTNDEVFLLSYQDYNNEDYGFKSNKSRIAKVTDFAKASGAYCSTSDSNLDASYHITRSPSDSNSNCLAAIRYTGTISTDRYVSNDGFGIRPAITFKDYSKK